jgi:chromosome segregation protein
MKNIVENLEKEKDEFRLEHEKEIMRIKEQKNMAEEEKKKLIEKLNNEIEENKRMKDETKLMVDKYKKIKKQVLNSEHYEKRLKEQENEILKHKQDLEKKAREEKKLQAELEQQMKQKLKIKKIYDTNQEHIDDLNEKIKMLRQRIEECKTENKENEDRLSRDLINLQDDIKVILIDNMKKDFILQNFIPNDEREKISKCIEYNEKKGKYFINKIQAIKNN